MSFTWKLLAMILLLGGSLGCTGGRHSSAGFRLPEGNAARGQHAFLALECHRCHTVDGMEIPRNSTMPAPVPLGGSTARTITDGYLVTSIIHPRFSMAPATRDLLTTGAVPPMPDYADRVTARDLADLSAFLQDHYREIARAPQPSYY